MLSGSSDEFPIKTSGHEDGSRPCLLEKESKEKYGPMPGAFIPQCDDDGYYRPKQCWGSTGSCWCVDKFGKKLQKKTANPGEELECGMSSLLSRVKHLSLIYSAAHYIKEQHISKH